GPLLVHDAGLGGVRPLLLHRPGLAVAAGDRALLAVADVADLAVVRVVPGERLADDGGEPDLRVGHRLDQLVRGDRGLVGERRAPAAADIAARTGAHVGQDAVEDLLRVALESAVVGAEAARDARSRAALRDGFSFWKINHVHGVGVGRGQDALADLRADLRLDRRIADGLAVARGCG